MTDSKAAIIVRILTVVAVLLATTLIATGSNLGPSPARGELSRGLFIDSTRQGSLDSTGEPTIIRTRFVEIDFDLLARGDQPLVLNLFEDVQFVADLDQVQTAPSGALIWTGEIEGVAFSQVVLVLKDGILVGNVSMPGAFYQVRYAGAGMHAIHEIDQSAFPQELPPIPVDIPDEALAQAANTPMLDDGSTIDVLVVYTPAARAAAGGTTAMETLIDLAIAETNTAYANSSVAQRVNLVHTAEVSYTESGFSTALDDITGTSDGKMDNVHTLRDTYAADEVVLIIEDPSSCGIAWIMMNVSTAFEDRAFAVVHRTCATGYYSFGHELGHNMGARHDWYVDNATTPYSYSHGYVNFPDSWRTIMAYNSECDDRSGYCTRLPYWSNPNVTYNSDAMGVPEGTSTACAEGVIDPNCDADNHKTLDNTAYTVANFRQSANVPNAPTSLSAAAVSQSRIDLSWTDNSGNENGFKIERSPNGSSSWTQIAAVGANVTTYANTGLSSGATYYYRVRAYNATGDSGYSNVAHATTWAGSTEAVFLPLVSKGPVSAPGFNSQFNGSAPGWEPHSGAWWIDNGAWYATDGLSGSSASASYAADFTNFDYEAALWRSGCDTCSNRLVVRGTPDPLSSSNHWYNEYTFQYSRNGSYSIWKRVAGGSAIEIQAWTGSSAINQGADWNVLRVVANGSNLYLYINGTLVWSGSDSSLASGRVGISMYRSADSTGDQLWVDWATLSPLSADFGPGEVSAEQQALNHQANRNRGGDMDYAPSKD